MAVDRVIQELMDLIEPPDDGDQARPASDFGANRDTGSDPHVGFDMNRGRGVQPHGRVRSPVYGMVKEIQPKLGRIVIEEWDPINLKPTGYDVEILHTQTRTVKPGDSVAPEQLIGTQGDVGAPGAFHAHVQVVRSDDQTRTPLNPMRHLFEYHHPGEPIPPLPQFEPQQVPPREKRGAAAQSGNRGQPAPSDAQPSQSAPQPAVPVPPQQNGGPKPRPTAPPPRSPQLPPSRPGIGPPLDITPRLAPGMANPGAAEPRPAPDGLPPLHFAPETPHRFGPFEVPGLFQSDAVGSPPVASPADGTPTNPSIPPSPLFGSPSTSSPATSPAPSGMAGQIGDGNGIGHWWNGLVTDVDAVSRRNGFGGLSIPMPNNVPTPPTQTVFDRGLPGMLQRAGAFDPSAGGLLGLLQEYMRNNPHDDVSA